MPKVKLVDEPNKKQREKAEAQEEIKREARYRRGFSQSIVIVRVLIAGGATDKDLQYFFRLIYEWRIKGKVFKDEFSNMTVGSPVNCVLRKDTGLKEIYYRGLKVYRE